MAHSQRGSAARLIVGLPLAAIATVAIFLFMGDLTRNEEVVVLGDPPPPVVLPTVRPDGDPAPPVPTDRPDPTTITRPAEPIVTPTGPTSGPTVPNPAPDVPMGGEGDFNFPRLSLKDAILAPLPVYPQRCAARGIEGTASVQFDVLASGAVTNARIVASDNSCFDRAAIRAIEQWKFNPSGDGGTAIAQRGLIKTFRFELTG